MHRPEKGMYRTMASAGLVLYMWSSKIYSHRPAAATGHERHSNAPLLRHVERRRGGWLMGSSVCSLGKLAWAMWVALLLVWHVLRWKMSTYFWIPLMSLTVLVTAWLNVPLFIRSLPAYCVLVCALTAQPAYGAAL